MPNQGWIPASAGMTVEGVIPTFPFVIPAKAGIYPVVGQREAITYKL